MIVATRSTSGPTPRCLRCGTAAAFIDLNASWTARCNCLADLVTDEQLDREVVWAKEALNKAMARRDGFRRLVGEAPVGPSVPRNGDANG